MRIDAVDPKGIDLRDVNLVALVGTVRKMNKWTEPQSTFRSIKFKLELRDYQKEGEQWWQRTSWIDVLCMGTYAAENWDQVSEGARVSVIGSLFQNEMKSEEGHRTKMTTVEAMKIKKLQDRQEATVVDALDALSKRVQERKSELGVEEKPILDLEEVLEADDSDDGLDESVFSQGMVDAIIADGPDDDSTGFASLGSFEATSGKIENVLGPQKEVNEYDPFR